MESAELKHRPHIDGLRGVAVIAVLCFHAFPTAFPGGSVGVDIFFVISGFLISNILFADFSAPTSRVSSVMSNFYFRRARRIFPALIIVLIACYGLGFVLLLPSEFANLAAKMVASTGFYLNFLLSGHENYFSESPSSNPLLHLWSLAVEEQFYLVWPLTIWILMRSRIKILPFVVFLAAFSYCWNAQKFAGTGADSFYLPQMRMWEILIGAISAVLFPMIPKASSSNFTNGRAAMGAAQNPRRLLSASLVAHGLSILGIALIAAGFIWIKRDEDLPNKWTLLPTVGAACIVCSSGSALINRWILSRRILVWVGLISYPLYLWHWPLLVFAQISSDHPTTLFQRLSILAASVVLASLTYLLVEKPIRKGGKLAHKAVILTSVMALVAALGYITKRAYGFPSRYPALINEISLYKYNPAVALRVGTYFLMGDQDETNFKKDPNEILSTRPTIYLWGDSHAAVLYPGLNEVYGKRFNIVQRTTAKTAPFMADYFNPGGARQINEYVLTSIIRDKPEYVMLEADWPEYEWTQVERTIVALQAAGIRHVVLVGPVPQWIGTLPQQLFNYARKHRSEPVPVRMSSGLDPRPVQVDKLMAAFSERLGIEYISPCQILGNRDGFLVRVGDTPESITTFDSSHLTPVASTYLVSHFPQL
jgi:peptidoglycan/LPS O-acetylase OafA/YrhL